jgi:hypothetical protein
MNKFTAAFSFVLMVMAFAPAFAADEVANGDGPFPVWLSPYSPVKSLDDVEEAWTRPFGHENEKTNANLDSYELTYFKNLKFDPESSSFVSEEDPATANNCEGAKSLEGLGYETSPGKGERSFYEYRLSNCYYFSQLKTVKPAKNSYVRDFELTEQSIFALPVFLAGTLSCSLLCSYKEANKHRIPLSRFWKVSELIVKDEFFLQFKLHDTRSKIFLLAKGDFNGDGIEDLFVNLRFSIYAGSVLTSERNFVLTRDHHGAVLRVVDPETHLCSSDYPPFVCTKEHSDLSDWLDISR